MAYIPPHKRAPSVPKPPSIPFLQRPYNASWKANWETYARDATIPLANRFHQAQQYSVAVQGLGLPAENEKKKRIAFQNRQKEFLEAAYIAAGGPPIIDKRAGCVIVFSDRKALYTVTKDQGVEKYGFPKGEIEFVLPNPADIRTVTRENSVSAALRELREETGFQLSAIPVPTTLPQPFVATLRRLQYPDVYTVKSVKYHRDNENYYLILYLQEASTATGPSLLPLTSNASNEKIIRYDIRDQFTPATQLKFNAFSRISFPLPAVPGGMRRHRLTRKSITKRRTRKTMRSRG